LLSNHFFYFGNKPVPLPDHLLPVVKQTQGHRSHSNAAHLEAFVEWLHRLGHKPNVLMGKPQFRVWPGMSFRRRCSKVVGGERTSAARPACERMTVGRRTRHGTCDTQRPD